MKSKFTSGTCSRLQILALVFLLVPLTVSAQMDGNQKTSWAGKYEGSIKAPNGDLLKVTLELKDENGKISGHATTPHGAFEVVKATVANDVLTLELSAQGSTGKIVARQKGDKLAGTWWFGYQTGALELLKVIAKDELSGEWTAVADANGQNFPFTLVLKLDGDKLSGSSSSELGESAITEGAFKDGKLIFKLNGSSGVIAMAAVLQDGKLNGEYDFAGQMQGKWVAVKKQ